MFTTTAARAGEIIRPTDLHARGMVRGELARTHALLCDLDPADWLRLTDCTGWRVRDVVAHIISGNEELPGPPGSSAASARPAGWPARTTGWPQQGTDP